MAENETKDVSVLLLQKLEERPETVEHLVNIIDRLGTLEEFITFLESQKNAATDMMVQRVADNITTGMTIMDSFSGSEQIEMVKVAGEKAESIKKSIELIDELQKSGAINALKDLGDLAAAFNRSATDSMVERMAGTMEKMGELSGMLTEYDLKPLLELANSLKESGSLEALPDLINAIVSTRNMLTEGIIMRAVGILLNVIEATSFNIDMSELMKSFNRSVYAALEEDKEKEKEFKKTGVFSILHLMKDPEVSEAFKFFGVLSKHLMNEMKERKGDIFHFITKPETEEEKVLKI